MECNFNALRENTMAMIEEYRLLWTRAKHTLSWKALKDILKSIKRFEQSNLYTFYKRNYSKSSDKSNTMYEMPESYVEMVLYIVLLNSYNEMTNSAFNWREHDKTIGAESGGQGGQLPPGDILAPLDDFCPPSDFYPGPYLGQITPLIFFFIDFESKTLWVRIKTFFLLYRERIILGQNVTPNPVKTFF